MNASNLRANPGIPELNYATAGGTFPDGSSLKIGLNSQALILKMNFNFNFKDSLPQRHPSIRRLTTGCDLNHSVCFRR
jgi:hypothetical protein